MPGINTTIGIRTSIGGIGSSSRNWTPQTLVVEDAQPTHVVITFNKALTNDIYTDYISSIGNVLSVSRNGTNLIHTLVIDTAINISDTLTITYKGKVYPVLNNVLLQTPFRLTATIASSSVINLKVDYNGAGEDGFSWERSANGTSGWAEIATTTVKYYSNTGLANNTTYYYRVRVFKALVYSAYSNIDHDTTLTNSALIEGWKFENANEFQNVLTDYYGFMPLNGESAICYNGKTYIAYAGADDDPYVTCVDHSTGLYTAPVKIGTNPLTNGDGHGQPCIWIDTTGHILCIWGSHDGNFSYAKSTNAEDISAWTAKTSPTNGTYPQFVQLSDGTLYLFYRDDATTYKWAYRTSSDNGETWSAKVPFSVGIAYWKFKKGVGDTIHVVGFGDSTTDIDRKNIYYMLFSGGVWKNKAGTLETLPVLLAGDTQIYNSGANYTPYVDISIDASNNPYFIFTESAAYTSPTTRTFKFMKYVSGSQVIVNIGLSVSYYANSIAALDVRSSTNIDAYIVSGAINGGNVEKWTSSDLGTTWAKQKLIMNGTNIYPILVYNYNPDAKIVFASWDSTGYHGGIARGYLYGNKGFVINTGIAVPTTTASMKGGCDGILVNAPAQVTGKYGLGYQFVAATKHNIRIPDNDLLSFAGSTPFSITAWINVTTVTGAHYIVSKSELDTLNEYAIDIYNSNIYFVVQSPVNFANYIRSFTPFTTLNTWVFICATCDGSGTKEGLQMCINAAEPAHTHDSGGTYTGMTNGTGPLSIGGQGRTTGDGTYFTDGLIDEVKIWNKVLSLAEQANVRDNIEW